MVKQYASGSSIGGLIKGYLLAWPLGNVGGQLAHHPLPAGLVGEGWVPLHLAAVCLGRKGEPTDWQTGGTNG